MRVKIEIHTPTTAASRGAQEVDEFISVRLITILYDGRVSPWLDMVAKAIGGGETTWRVRGGDQLPRTPLRTISLDHVVPYDMRRYLDCYGDTVHRVHV